MIGRSSSLFILIGGVLVFLALWVLSIQVVRRDARGRGMRDLERKAWVIVAVALPLFGFALYLFVYVLRRYLTPQEGAGAEVVYPVESRVMHLDEIGDTRPAAVPAWGNIQKDRSNGSARSAAQGIPDQTPATIVAPPQAPARGSAPRYVLTIGLGPEQGREISLAHFPVRIGRGPDADIALDGDLNISRSHCELYEWNGALHIRDLSSTHGTQVNGIPVRDQPLHPGDQIHIGGTLLILHQRS